MCFFAAWGNSGAPPLLNSIYAKTEKLNCRQSPDSKAILVHSFTKDEKLVANETSGDWQKVSYEGNFCWVKTEYTYSKQEYETNIETRRANVNQEIFFGLLLAVIAFVIRKKKTVSDTKPSLSNMPWYSANLKATTYNSHTSSLNNNSVEYRVKVIQSLKKKNQFI